METNTKKKCMPCPFIGPKLFCINPNCFEKGPYFMNIGLNKKFSNENTVLVLSKTICTGPKIQL